jgi:hypothetical protein
MLRNMQRFISKLGTVTEIILCAAFRRKPIVQVAVEDHG